MKNIKEILKIQITISIAFLIIGFTLISIFPETTSSLYGLIIIPFGGIAFGVIHIAVYSFISFIIYLILSSLFLYDERKFWFILSQIFYWIGIVILLFGLSYLIPEIIKNNNPFNIKF